MCWPSVVRYPQLQCLSARGLLPIEDCQATAISSLSLDYLTDIRHEDGYPFVCCSQSFDRSRMRRNYDVNYLQFDAHARITSSAGRRSLMLLPNHQMYAWNAELELPSKDSLTYDFKPSRFVEIQRSVQMTNCSTRKTEGAWGFIQCMCLYF